MPAPKNYMFTTCIPNTLHYFKNRNKEILKTKISQFGSKMLKIKQKKLNQSFSLKASYNLL